VIAAGLVMTALHTANEAGWLTVGQTQAANLAWLVRPGTPVESFVSGVLGIQPYPVWIEVMGWFAYLLPMLALVISPRPTRAQRRKRPRAAATSNASQVLPDGQDPLTDDPKGALSI
jgi:high-affinity iron transporter